MSIGMRGVQGCTWTATYLVVRDPDLLNHCRGLFKQLVGLNLEAIGEEKWQAVETGFDRRREKKKRGQWPRRRAGAVETGLNRRKEKKKKVSSRGSSQSGYLL